MEAWQEKFRETCLILKSTGRVISDLNHEGIITFQEELKCSEGHKSVYAGMEIDIGLLITVGNAVYCPTCDKVTLLEQAPVTFAAAPEGRFLETLKRRFSERGAVEPVTMGDPCPVCNKTTNIFYSYNFRGTNLWAICPDPDCLWPGEHKLEEQNRPSSA